MKPKRILSALVALGLVATACGGASGDNPAEAAVADEPAAESPTEPSVDAEPPEAPGADPEPAAEPTEESAPDTEPARAEASADLGVNQLPEVDVINLATGETVNLASFAPGEKPIVLWFWAPF